MLSDGLGSYGYPIIETLWQFAFPNTKIIHDTSKTPTLVIKSHFNKHETIQYVCPYILFSGEPYRVPKQPYLPICELNCFIHNNQNCFYVPFFSYAHINPQSTYLHSPRTPTQRPYMLSYVNRHPVKIRETTYKKIHQLYPKLCHGLGGCQTTPGKRLTNKDWTDTYKYITDYTSHIAMENEDVPGYITEKIFTAYKADCIPLYWGGGDYTNCFINDSTYINHKHFTSPAKLAEHIYNIHADIQKKIKYFNDPIAKKPLFDYIDVINKDPDNLPRWITPIINKLRDSFPDY